MKSNSQESQKKNKKVDASDDTLGENTEQTPLAKELEKEKQKKKNKERPKQGD
ncbi:MAG: hypothetical protein WD426_16835 [Anditalea sp.]